MDEHFAIKRLHTTCYNRSRYVIPKIKQKRFAIKLREWRCSSGIDTHEESMAEKELKQAMTPVELELAKVMVAALNLDLPAEELDPEMPLYGSDGLGLDSIDMLEIALVVSRNYGFQLRSDSEDNMKVFQSLRSLSQHVEANRTK
jgi:acyl carrier protein